MKDKINIVTFVIVLIMFVLNIGGAYKVYKYIHRNDGTPVPERVAATKPAEVNINNLDERALVLRNNDSIAELNGRIMALANDVKMNIQAMSNLRLDILNALLSEKTEEIVKGAKTDQERCLRVSRWIAANIPNRQSQMQPDTLGWYAYRYGVCGERSQLFVKMLEYLNIKAQVFMMHNFGGPGGGHACAQAFYDDEWHFFDSTYAGVFIKDGKVLSWDEITANPEDALKHMVVFEDTLDIGWDVDPNKINKPKRNDERNDNVKRMNEVYTIDSLTNAHSCGFWRTDDPKYLYCEIDTSEINKGTPIVLGEIDKQYEDVSAAGLKAQISERLGLTLGNTTYTYHTKWQFSNCIPGKTYVIKYYLYKSHKPNMEYWARAEGAKITSGDKYIASDALYNGQPDIWAIEFIPDDKECSISVGYDFRKPESILFLDKIEILVK